MNEERPLVSVIVPVYKTGPYLRRCVDSLLAQTYPNMEILLVDDGSPDDAGKICDEIAAEENFVRVIHKTNGGLSSARNAGMEKARGRFFLFCDSDDTVDADWAAVLTETALEHQNELVGCALRHVNGAGETVSVSGVAEGRVEKADYYKLIVPGMVGSVCIKAFRADLIREHGIRFDETVRYAEDVVFTLDYLAFTEAFYFTDRPLYNYYHYERSEHQTITSCITYPQMRVITEKRLPYISEEDREAFEKMVFGNYWDRFCRLDQEEALRNREEQKLILKDSLFQDVLKKNGKSLFDKRSLFLLEHGNLTGYRMLQKLSSLRRGR